MKGWGAFCVDVFLYRFIRTAKASREIKYGRQYQVL